MTGLELQTAAEPFFRVMHGTPDEHELAALTAALLIALRRRSESDESREPAASAARWNAASYTPPGSWARA